MILLSNVTEFDEFLSPQTPPVAAASDWLTQLNSQSNSEVQEEGKKEAEVM